MVSNLWDPCLVGQPLCSSCGCQLHKCIAGKVENSTMEECRDAYALWINQECIMELGQKNYYISAIAGNSNGGSLVVMSKDRLALNFRKTAGLPAPGTPHGGWEAPDVELRGHFVGNFLSVTRKWSSNDKMALELPLILRTEAIKDERPMYYLLQAILYGPYLLAGLTDGDWELKTASVKSLSDWISPIPANYNSQLVMRTALAMRLARRQILMQLHGQSKRETRSVGVIIHL